MIFELLDNFELNEDFLTENIPPDLAKAYKYLNNEGSKYRRYDSQYHQDSNHSELNAARGGARRFAQWDYGKSTYTELTKDEAKEYVRQDRMNCMNLRMLKNGRLVEVEPKGNGNSVYAIYRDSNMAVIDNGVVKKNIGYVTNINRIIDIVDKIYKTDEYDHKISDDEMAKRNYKSQFKMIGSYMPAYIETEEDDIDPETGEVHVDPETKKPRKIKIRQNNPKRDPHNPSNNYMANVKKYIPLPDTGEHDPYLAGSSSFVGVNSGLLYEINKAYAAKNKAYDKYDSCRKMLKKIEREKNDYDNDEYAELKAKWEAALKDTHQEYDIALKTYKDANDKVYIQLDKTSEAFRSNLQEYYSELQKIMGRTYAIGNDLKSEISKSPGSPKDLSGMLTHLRELSANVKKDLDNIKSAGQDLNQLMQDNPDISDKFSSLNKLITDWNLKSTEKISDHLDKMQDLERQLAEIKNDELLTYDTYMPTLGAKKRANIERNRPKLDAALEPLLSFDD